jgi:serine/threonine protein kinase
MGEVYRARDTRLDREVAIKLLPAEVSSDPDRLKRFEQEARATSALNHPNILTVYNIGTNNGSPYIVAELLEGEELGTVWTADRFRYAKRLTPHVKTSRGEESTKPRG